MKTYTIGQIFREGLLKNNKGEPYKHKATISKIVNKLDPIIKDTPFGQSKLLPLEKIEGYNSHWKKFAS
jgi:hypothetical protein